MQNIKRNLIKKFKTAILISIFSVLILGFFTSYFLTSYFLNSDKAININSKNETVYNENNKYLSDSTYVTLKTKDNIDLNDNISSLKLDLNLNDDLTLTDLSNELSKKGYILYEYSDNLIVYTRDLDSYNTILLADKYYLSFEDDFISLLKTDSNGSIIENEKKVYSDSKPLSSLPEIDQDYIKNNKFYFDTREEALVKLSELIS